MRVRRCAAPVVAVALLMRGPSAADGFGGFVPDIPDIPAIPSIPSMPTGDDLNHAAGWMGDTAGSAASAAGSVASGLQGPCDPAAVTAMQVTCGGSTATACSAACITAFQPLALACPVSLKSEL